jgi:predicted AAA+ superfamily ATPase
MDIFWENRNWEIEDRHLKKMKQMPFRRPFPFIPTEDGLYIIRGPRQVGKSCWLKSILSHYAKTKRCFYLSCEQVKDYRELGEILKSVKGYDIVLLDEVSFVEDWTRAVKHVVDSGLTKILVVTGSHAYDLKLGADRMPGRFDGGGEYALLPMDFDEFCAARKEAGWFTGDRLKELQAYFMSGGFPNAVAEAGKSGKASKNVLNTYWRWLVGDVVKLGKSEEQLTELVIQIGRTIQSPISFNTLAKKTGIGSHNTVSEYISVLESCFAIRTLYGVDIDTGAFRPRKDRKFYFTDPLLYWLSIHLSGRKAPEDCESEIAELVANEHLARRFTRFGYHGNSNGEVDFILPTRWAIEVKWSSVATNLSKTYLNLSLPEKIVWTQRNFLDEWPRLNPSPE